MLGTLRILYYVTFILLFLPNFVLFIIPNTEVNFSYGIISLIILYILSFISNYKKFLNFLINVCKLNVVRYYLIFLLFCLLTSTIHSFLGFYTAPPLYYLMWLKNTLCSLILIYFFPVIAIYLKINIKNIIKLFYIMLFIIILVGFIQYFSFIYNINILSVVIEFFANERKVRVFDDCQELLRAYSIFMEPSRLASFIFYNLSFIIYITKTKYKIFNSIALSKVFKHSLLPLSLSTLIFTKSPIWTIFTFIEFFILLFFLYRKIIIKYMHMIGILLFSVIITAFFINLNVDLSNTYLGRINKTKEAIGSIENLSSLEPSLATRVISCVIHYGTFKDNPIFGVGMQNSEVYAYTTTLPKYNYSLNKELLLRYIRTYHAYSLPMSHSVIWTTLAETGITGLILYFIFIIKQIKSLVVTRRLFNGFCCEFVSALYIALVAYFFVMFIYTGLISEYYRSFIFGLSLMIIYYAQSMRISR